MTPMTLIGKIRQALQVSLNGESRLDDVSINQGRILSSLNEAKTSKRLKDFEFKVFSQWGEDGIIQHLTRAVDIKNKTFIEFGVEDFFESNCRFLMMKDDWRGFVIDGSRENIARLKKSNFYWKHHLDAVDAFITKDNINALLAKSGFDADLGILSVDLDGNDYYVLEAIENFRPRILICEYNPIFGATRKISVPDSMHFPAHSCTSLESLLGRIIRCNDSHRGHQRLRFGRDEHRKHQRLLREEGTGQQQDRGAFCRRGLFPVKLPRQQG